MSLITWTPLAVSSESRPWRAHVWRIVEAQHIASSMKLVDSASEQDLLETLLDESKPRLSKSLMQLDYLLATPFRYPPRQGGSRFRGPIDPGVFYGAESIRTACAELGFWRWKFLSDAVDLKAIEPVAHTAFRVEIATNRIDLRIAPFDRDANLWSHLTDYSHTQALAQIAREAGTGAIVYTSVRDPDLSWCAALLTYEGFVKKKPDSEQQTWWLTVNQKRVVWRRDRESFSFIFR